MPVKPSQSAARVLAALGKIAEHQPIGVSELARLLGANLAATQRAIATLAEEGWIRMAIGKPTRWELTAQIHIVAQHAHGSNDLRRRARGPLEALWRETSESVLLIVPDGGEFIVIDVYESPHHVRSSPPVGFVISATASATAWALLPYLSPDMQLRYLGGEPDARTQEMFERTLERGYSVSRGDVSTGSNNVAAPIFEIDGRPVGAVLISVPTERASEERIEQLGELVRDTAGRLSRGRAPHVETAGPKAFDRAALIS